MLPPSSTEMGSGPRRATKVAPPALDLPLPLNQTAASARMRTTPARRQRDCRLRNANTLFWFDICDLLPPPVVFDVEYSHIDPKLQPGNRVPHHCLLRLVFRMVQTVLGFNLFLRLAA